MKIILVLLSLSLVEAKRRRKYWNANRVRKRTFRRALKARELNDKCDDYSKEQAEYCIIDLEKDLMRCLTNCDADISCIKACEEEHRKNIERTCPCYWNCKKGCFGCDSYQCSGMTLIDPETAANVKPNVDFEVGKVELQFSDEFNGKNINPARWDIVYKDRGWKFGIHRFWKKQNVKCCENGKIEMIFTKDGDRDYSGGCLNTQDRFAPTSGIFEIRMKIVWPHSMQSCFWMMPHDCAPDDEKCDGAGLLPDGVPDGKANKGAEVDIVEANSQKNQFSTGVHWDGYGEYHQSYGRTVGAPNLHTGYHTWTLQWNKKNLRFYFDGVLKRHITEEDKIPWVAEHLIVSGAVFNSTWVDGDLDTAHFPSSWYVDYVRAWDFVTKKSAKKSFKHQRL